jgi:hypothetical protein
MTAGVDEGAFVDQSRRFYCGAAVAFDIIIFGRHRVDHVFREFYAGPAQGLDLLCRAVEFLTTEVIIGPKALLRREVDS